MPLADPRLITMMVTFQFRNLGPSTVHVKCCCRVASLSTKCSEFPGYFGIFWILLLVIIVVAVYFYLKRSPSARKMALSVALPCRPALWQKGMRF